MHRVCPSPQRPLLNRREKTGKNCGAILSALLARFKYLYVVHIGISWVMSWLTGRNSFGTFLGGNGTENTPDVFRHDNIVNSFLKAKSSIFFIFSQKRKGKRNSSMLNIDSYVICLHWGRYLLVTRYLLA